MGYKANTSPYYITKNIVSLFSKNKNNNSQNNNTSYSNQAYKQAEKAKVAKYGNASYAGLTQSQIDAREKIINSPVTTTTKGPSSGTSEWRAYVGGTTQNKNSSYDWQKYLEGLLGGSGGGIGYAGRFSPSQAYTDAMAYTNSLLEKLNSGRTSYSDKIDALMGQIENRDKFVYDMDKDPMFQQYLSSMMDKGKLAMQDTIGQAAGLTGGYGSTYATSAANGAYNDYIKSAYDNVSDYYNMSLSAYNSEGQELYNRLGMYQTADASEYDRLASAYSANLANANTLYDREYNNYWDTANYNKSVAQYNNSQKQKLAELYASLMGEGSASSTSGTSATTSESVQEVLKNFLTESNHADTYAALQNMYKQGGSLDDPNSDYYKLMDTLYQQGYDVYSLDSAVRSNYGTAELTKDRIGTMFDKYTVQLPDGTTQTLSKKEIEKLVNSGVYVRYLNK